MPLRAKIRFQESVSARRQLSTDSDVPRQQPEDTPDDVLFHSLYGVRTIELNRPKKLNSLDGSMIRKILPRLIEWEKSDMINAVIMKGAGEKALCAGGDVATLAGWNKEGPEGVEKSKEYFRQEYKLDHFIATYSKPYISFMDGITMGGGVGLSIHAPFRIATERTLFAMPETSIGFFPEVGGSFFLPRMDGQLGKYLALTNERLHGVQTYYHGIATHYLHSSSLPDLENRISELSIPDFVNLSERLRIINTTISEFVTGLPHDQPIKLAGNLRRAIDRCFEPNNLEGIITALEQEKSNQLGQSDRQSHWADMTLKTLCERSPTSLKTTLRQLELGKSWSISEAFQRESEIASRFMEHPDFVEGVSKKLIEKSKEKPQWTPKSLEEVTVADIDHMLRPQGGNQTLSLLKGDPSSNYKKYPHAWIGLPSDVMVRNFVEESDRTTDDILDQFDAQCEGRLGVRAIVGEILDRKTVLDDDLRKWVD